MLSLPVMFRRLKETGDIDIWFPTILAKTENGVYFIQVYGSDGHGAGNTNIMNQISTIVSNPFEYNAIKVDYERRFDLTLKPYVRWQPWFTQVLGETI